MELICWRFGISRPTAYRRWRHALQLIACVSMVERFRPVALADGSPSLRPHVKHFWTRRRRCRR